MSLLVPFSSAIIHCYIYGEICDEEFYSWTRPYLFAMNVFVSNCYYNNNFWLLEAYLLSSTVCHLEQLQFDSPSHSLLTLLRCWPFMYPCPRLNRSSIWWHLTVRVGFIELSNTCLCFVISFITHDFFKCGYLISKAII